MDLKKELFAVQVGDVIYIRTDTKVHVCLVWVIHLPPSEWSEVETFLEVRSPEFHDWVRLDPQLMSIVTRNGLPQFEDPPE